MLPLKEQRFFLSMFAGYLVHFLHNSIEDYEARFVIKSNPLKRVVKHRLQHAPAKPGPYTRSHSAPSRMALMYHRILPLNDDRPLIEEPGLIVTPGSFSNHLKLIKKHFDIVCLSDWIYRKHDGRALPSKASAITFDDGWSDNYECAFPILKERSIRNHFPVSGMSGTNLMFWPG